MSLRKTYGKILEEKLNELVDNNLKDLSTAEIKAELHELTDKLVDKHLAGIIDGLGEKLKANFIDMINGVDDIPNV